MMKNIYFLLLCLCFYACDVINYHPYDGRLNSDTETGINRKNIERITSLCENKDTIRFAFMGDTQESLDETKKFVEHINRGDSVDFVIHGGDIADFGMTKEFEWTHDVMKKLNVPYVALIGNHDILGNGDGVFRKMYGNENYSFIAGDIKFVCLNTNALEYDYSNPVPDFGFIKQELADSLSHTRTIVVMHAPPGNEQFNNNVMDVFHLYIKNFPSLLFCLHAHEHNFKVRDIFEDGVLYYGCENMGKKSYLLFIVTKEGYTYELVRF